MGHGPAGRLQFSLRYKKSEAMSFVELRGRRGKDSGKQRYTKPRTN